MRGEMEKASRGQKLSDINIRAIRESVRFGVNGSW